MKINSFAVVVAAACSTASAFVVQPTASHNQQSALSASINRRDFGAQVAFTAAAIGGVSPAFAAYQPKLADCKQIFLLVRGIWI